MGISRRNFLHFVVSGAISGGILALFKVKKADALPRPHGAIIEEEFLGFCTRCLECIDVCQPLALRPAGIFDGIANIGTPVMDVTKCIICMECIRACPTDALKKIPKEQVDLGTAVINKDICLAWQKKKRCEVCYKACPTKAFRLEKKRYPVLEPEKCNGCGICVRRCPTAPKSVIVSYKGAKRFAPPKTRFALRLEDRVGPYEFPPPDFKTWFVNRIRTLAEHYGIRKRNQQ
jgi:ferredoxin-type protein NapG